MQPSKTNKRLRHLLAAPFLYSLIIPIVLQHLFVGIYHLVAFRLYGIPLIDGKKYIKLDRHKLKYLSWFDKINCIYCGYANGLADYSQAIAAATEKYWCAIKHGKDEYYIEPAYHRDFLEYGDEQGYRKIKRTS